ncbi:hypothetical protein AHF37_08256, partial [Paragonimus kellicotti]
LLAPSGDELLRRFQLAHPVLPEHCSYRVSPVKIELRLRKVTETKWNELELEVSQDGIKDSASPIDGVTKTAHTYPSSSKVAHDWSKLEKEAAEIEDDVRDRKSDDQELHGIRWHGVEYKLEGSWQGEGRDEAPRRNGI